MQRKERYGTTSLAADFPTEDAALDFLFEAQHSYKCSCGGKYKRVRSRKQYQCSTCRTQIAPLADTIFHKSDTPLLLWFKAILAFSNAKSSISAKQLERELEVTYKTAWRMLFLIRSALAPDDIKLKGIVEMDTGYLGGIRAQKEKFANKTVIMAAKERGGNIRAAVAPDSSTVAHYGFLSKNIQKGSHLMTDGANTIKSAARGWDHYTVNHNKREFVRGPVHVNSIEGFFAHVKRSVKGVHKTISQKHAQAYLNGFVFHWNNGRSDKERFGLLLGTLLRTAK